jgi:hypothetical protein
VEGSYLGTSLEVRRITSTAEMIISLLALVAAIYLIAQRIGFVRWRREYELSIDRLIRAIHPGREGGSAVEFAMVANHGGLIQLGRLFG